MARVSYVKPPRTVLKRLATHDAGGVGATVVPSRWAVATVVACLLFLGGLVSAGTAKASAPAASATAEPDTPGTCFAPTAPSGVRGELSVDGGPLPPTSVAGVALTYTYSLGYRSLDANGTVVAAGCVLAEGNTTTAANGSFSFVPVTPPATCTPRDEGSVCTVYSAPYVPVHVTLAEAPPVGYGVSSVGWTSPVDVALVYELASVTIAPGGPAVTASVGAPTTFTATAWAGNGTTSPLSPQYSWSLNGTGWSFVGLTTGRSVVVSAVTGGSVAIVTVRAQATAGGLALAPVTASATIVAVATMIEAAETDRTVLDAGRALTVNLTAVGAAGYPYSAVVAPGLGLSDIPVPCSTVPATSGSVQVECRTTVTYPYAGTAQPSANVTNGYSTANWRFPDIVVELAPELEVAPAAPVGYVGESVPLTVTVANGSGTPPYVQGCLNAPPEVLLCQPTPGPTWSFSPTFSRPGNFTVVASALDGDGVNASFAFPVAVVPRLGLGPLTCPTANASVGVAVEIETSVGGGVAPLRYWWNASGASGPLLAGQLAQDGIVAVTLVPADVGSIVVTLTVLDRLGTVVAGELLLSVAPAEAGRVALLAAPPTGPITAGEPVTLTWGALDGSGAPALTFEGAAELRITAGSAPLVAWANASGVGALAPLGGGAFGVPAAAWVGGRLNVTVTVATADQVEVALVGTALPGVVPVVNLTVQPDRAHVRLFDPTVAHAGGRQNNTLWQVEDRFGNPVPGALLTVGLVFGSLRADTVVVTAGLADGRSGAWINYSAPGAGAGELTVTDTAGTVVLGPIPIPASAAADALSPTVDALAAVLPAGTAGAAALAVVRRRRRSREAAPLEEELRRLAEGRTRAVELVRQAGAIDLPGLEAAWGGAPPAALADWLASLVADGTLRATLGEDGRPRFCLAEGPAVGPRVTMDPDALDRSLRHRDEALEGSDGGAG